MRIHAVRTGAVVFKHALVAAGAHPRLRKLAVLLGRAVTPPLPVLCWLIEHPEGVIMVDAGMQAGAADSGYFDRDRDYRRLVRYARAFRCEISPAQEAGAQLKALGVDPRRDVRTLLLTHLHSDHADGLRAFPNADVFVARAELARTHYAFPAAWPIWFRPEAYDFDGPAHGAFAASHAITRAGDVLAVPTPGHTHGHASVIVRLPGREVILAGDATYSEAQLQCGEVAGGVADVALARATIATLQTHVRASGALYLPSHDATAEARLAAG
jgi:glyoxylase-like metal-dependent hydrolase (beta-lactamase superfamily II)